MEYQIKGDTLPVVICHLEAGEKMITRRRHVVDVFLICSWKLPQTEESEKHLVECFPAEEFFQNVYTSQGGKGLIAFASSFQGSIKAFQISREMK